MRGKTVALSLFSCFFLCLAACLAEPESSPAQPAEKGSPVLSQPSSISPMAEATPSPEPSVFSESSHPITDEEIGRRYTQAIVALESSVTLNVADREWKYGPENDLKNIYYGVLSQHQELKYAYDMTAEISGGRAECSFFYMPYKTGAYSQGLPAGSHIVSSLHDADVMAQSMIDGTERLSIAITDPTLEVEDLQRAAGQGGYGWITCSLSRDGTELTAAPPVDMTLSDCVENINESFRVADGILKEIVTDDMTDREKAEAVYTYITENVTYDFRYYSGSGDMPFTSTVALGALRDNLAICGGYSHALETLLDLCDIENYTVSGVSKGEYHAWNYVILDGKGYYCDPTADRHGMLNHFLLTEEELKTLGGYEWDAEFLPKLCR